MANSLTTRVANIVFNTKGVNAILNYQKQLVKDKKRELDIQQQLVNSMNGTEKTYAAEVKTLNKLTAEWKKLEKEEQTFKSDINAVTSTINNMGEASPKAINKLNSALARMSKNMGSMTAEAKEKFDALVGAIKPVTEALSQKFQKGFSDMMSFKPNTATWAELNNYVKEYNQNGRILAEVSNNEAKAFADMGAKAAKCMIEMGKMDGTLTKLSADADPTRIREYIAAWQKIQNFQGSNATIKAGAQNAINNAQSQLATYYQGVTANPQNFTNKEVKEATDWLIKYRTETKLTQAQVTSFAESIKKGEDAQKAWARDNEYANKLNQLGTHYANIKSLSNDATVEQIKFWTEVRKDSSSTIPQLNQAKNILQDFSNGALNTKAGKTLMNASTFSVTDIEKAISTMKVLQTTAQDTASWKVMEEAIQRGTNRIKELQAMSKSMALQEQFTAITSNSNASTESIKKLISEYTALIKSEELAGRSTTEYTSKVAQLNTTLRQRQEAEAKNVLANPLMHTNQEVKNAIALYEQLAKEEKAVGDDAAWKAKLAIIKNAKEEIAKYDAEIKKIEQNEKMQKFSKQMQNVRSLSNDALAENKKYWQSMVNGTEEGTKAYDKYYAKLRAVIEEEKYRAQDLTRKEGLKTLGNFNNGILDRGSTDIQDAINKLTKLRGIIDKNAEPQLFKQVSSAIRQLNQDLVQAQENVQLAQKYINVTDKGGAFKGTIADLEKVRSGLNDMRKKLKDAGQTDKIQELDAKIRQVDNDIRTAGIDAQEFKAALSNPASVSSLNTLKAAYAKLEAEIKRNGITQQEFNQKAAQMKAIKGRIDELNKSFKLQNTQLATNKTLVEAFGTNLRNIILHYVGLQMVFMRIINTFKDVFKLADQMTNVQKVTGMTATEVTRLVDELQGLDTRTSTEQLMQFAEQAGKLGIYAKQGVQGVKQFAEMGERISRTLGEDAGGAEAVANLVKINDIMGTTQEVMKRTGNSTTQLRDALDATGSAILNVGNNSAASYANVMNYVGRLGAIGSTVHMSVQEVIALGGALDALKMPAEAGATAMSQFIAAIQRRTDEMARAAILNVPEFRELASKDMMGAVMALVNQIKEGKASAQDLMDAMTGRSKTNVNLRNSLNLLAGHMELLNNQLRYAKDGFDSAFGGKTAGDIQLISQAMRDMGIDDSFGRINLLFSRMNSNATDMNHIMSQFKNYSGDMDMLRSAFENVFGAMNRLKDSGRLTSESIKDLATQTQTMSIMEQEFARVNENAAGKMERLGNTIKEKFVNSGVVSFFQEVASSLMEFTLWLGSGSAGATAFGSALAMLGTVLIATRAGIQAIIVKMKEWIAINITSYLNQCGHFISIAVARFGLLNGAIISIKAAWIGLMNVIKANPWIALATAIVGVVYAVKNAATEARKFAKATQEVNNELNQEIRTAASLYSQIKNLNKENTLRSSLISQFNNKYGTLLGYMVQEKTTANELARAYSLVVVKLKEKAKAQLQNQLIEQSQKDAAEKLADAEVKVAKKTEKVTSDVQKQAEIQTRISALVNERVATNPNEDTSTMMRNIMDVIRKEFNLSGGNRDVVNLGKAVKDLIDGVKEQAKATSRVSAFIAGQEVADSKQSNKVRNENNKAVAHELNTALRDAGKDVTKMSEDALKHVLEQMKAIVSEKEDYKKAAGDNKVLSGNIDKFGYWIRTLEEEQKRRNPNLYGTQTATTDPTKMTVEQLRTAHGNAKTAMGMAKDGVMWSAMGLDIPGLIDGMTEAAAREIIDAYDESLKEQAKKKHINLDGDGFDHGNETKKPKYDNSDAALAELDRYYSWLDEQEKERLSKQEITQAEYERRQLKNETEHHQKKGELYEYFNDKTKDGIVKWWGTITELDKVSWKKINDEQAKADEKHQRENALNAQKNFTEVQAMYAKSIQEINKLLLENNPTAKVLQKLKEELDSLGLLLGNDAMNDKILRQLRPLMNDIENLTEEELIAKLKQLPTLADILTGDEATVEKKLKAYIMKMTESAEEYTAALRKEANKSKKNIDFQYDSSVTKAGMTDNLSQLQQGANEASNLQSLGMGSDMATADAKLKVAQQEYELAMNKFMWELKSYDLELARLEVLKQQLEMRKADAELRGDTEEAAMLQEQLTQAELDYQDKKQIAMYATEEVRNQVLERQKAVDEAEHEAINTKMAYLKEYMGAFEEFGGSMTEAAFGTKEDRQNAAKELLKSVMQTTKKIMMAKLEELIFERTITQQKVSINQAMNNTITSQAGKSMMNQMTGTVAQTSTDVAAGTAAGGAKTVGQMGWWGIPLIAVIGAALSALMAVVMAQFNKSKSTIEATTSAGKMATGMLTYAAGRYPVYAEGYQPDGSHYTVTTGHQTRVQGNDGRTYNAVVKPNLTTGEYNRPHLGIVGERGAELIVDHPTFSRLKSDAPWILQGIYNMKRFGTARLNHEVANRAMRTLTAQQYPTHAAGNISQALANVSSDQSLDTNGGGSNEQLMATLTQLTAAITTLQSEGVKGHFNILGDGGLVDSYDKGKKFNTMVGK